MSDGRIAQRRIGLIVVTTTATATRTSLRSRRSGSEALKIENMRSEMIGRVAEGDVDGFVVVRGHGYSVVIMSRPSDGTDAMFIVL